jgi:hypothetical protein
METPSRMGPALPSLAGWAVAGIKRRVSLLDPASAGPFRWGTLRQPDSEVLSRQPRQPAAATRRLALAAQQGRLEPGQPY